jgi:hypothetical protein
LIVIALLLILIATVLILPGWAKSKSVGASAHTMLLIPVSGIGVWFALTYAGVGPQSLSNFIEVFAVIPCTVVAAYLALNAMRNAPGKGQGYAMATHVGVALLVVVLRVLMPVLPE